MREEPKMDAKRLITEVYKRPALWNQRHISYHNRDVTNRIWMEIATLFKLPKQVLKTKWKGLRDTFRAEIKKEQVYRKSKYTPNRPAWIHFKTLQFLKEQMLPRPPIWERGNNAHENDASSAAASEDSCTDASEGISDGAAIAEQKYRRVTPIATAIGSATLVTTTSTKDQRRASSRLSSSSLQLNKIGGSRRNSPAAQKSLLRKSCAADAVGAVSIKADLSPAVNSSTQHRSDGLSRLNSSNNYSSQISNRVSSNSGGNNNVGKNQIGDPSPVKLEPIDYEDNVEEFGNLAEEMSHLVDDGSMLESMSTEEVLMEQSAGENCVVVGGQGAVDPLEGNRFDDNYYFFMSLLPHMRSLPAERRMLLRMQMQTLVYQEVYKRSSTLPAIVTLHQAQDQRPR